MIGTYEERQLDIEDMYPVWNNDTLWSFFESNSLRFGKDRFLIYENVSYTYDEVRIAAENLSRSLTAAGACKGSHIAVCLGNRFEHVCLIFAIARIGAVRISVNLGAGNREIAHILSSSSAEIFITENSSGLETAAGIGCVRKIIAAFTGYRSENGITGWNEFLKSGDGVQLTPPGQVISADVCDMMFTSGSTSEPKGVLLTNDMVLRSGYATALTRGMEKGRRICVPIPLFHAFAYIEGLIPAITVGGALIMFTEHFSAEKTLLMMRKGEANDIITVPSIMISMLKKEKVNPVDYPHMHSAYLGGACPEWLWNETAESFGINDIGAGYGLTECASTVTIISPEDPAETVIRCHGRLKQAGKASPDRSGHLADIMVYDFETAKTSSTGYGELIIRGVTVTGGYYRNDEANERAFDADGWFHTGDLVTIGTDGYLTFHGRNDDMYKVNGENVSPAYVESIFRRHPEVTDIEIVGIRNPKYGEIGVAFVDTESADTERLTEELSGFAKNNLAKFQCPKFYIFLKRTGWPVTSTGKISKKGLRELAAAKLLSQTEGKND